MDETHCGGRGASWAARSAVVFALCLLLARSGQDGGALLVAGYALLWYTLIRMLVLGSEPEPLVTRRSSSP